MLLANRPLAANESYTQNGRDRFGSNDPIGGIRGLVYASHAGTLYLEESDDDGTTWSQTGDAVSVAAKTTTELAWTNLTKQQYRFRYVNGAAAQTKFRLVQQTRGLELASVTDTATQTALASVLAALEGTLTMQLSGSILEKGSGQDTQPATTTKTYNRAAGASRMEAYCESGYIRVRTDGQPCTSTTGEPIAAGFAAAWNAETISVFYVQESIVTVVSR